MPVNGSPVKTRGSSKAGPKAGRPVDKRTLSDSSLPCESNDMQSFILSAVETALTNDAVIGRLVALVADRVSESVNQYLKAQLQEALAEVDTLKTEVVDLKKRIKEQDGYYSRQLDDLEQYGRRNNLRVFGVEERAGENTDELLVDIFRNKLGVSVHTKDIDRSHRVGSRKQDEKGVARPRPIIVKFVSYRTRRDVFDAKKKLKGSAIIIREDLTQHRQRLLGQAITAHGTRNVWTLDGRVHWVTAENKRGQASWYV